jgi:hypothetical protein
VIDNNELFTIGAIFALVTTLAYKFSFFHRKKIGYIPIIQIFTLILVPGFIYTIIFSYVLEILARPLNDYIFLNDKFLTTLLLLSILYTYGGIAIHSISKTLSNYFTPSQQKSPLYSVNSFFHLSFSHNLTYIGAAVSAACFALLELNHLSPYPEQSRLLITILNGVFLGLAVIASLYWNRWYKRLAELKLFFFSLWALFIIVLYALKPYIKDVQAYPITLMMLVAFFLMATLNIFLYLKRYKNKLKLVWQIPKDLFS